MTRPIIHQEMMKKNNLVLPFFSCNICMNQVNMILCKIRMRKQPLLWVNHSIRHTDTVWYCISMSIPIGSKGEGNVLTYTSLLLFFSSRSVVTFGCITVCLYIIVWAKWPLWGWWFMCRKHHKSPIKGANVSARIYIFILLICQTCLKGQLNFFLIIYCIRQHFYGHKWSMGMYYKEIFGSFRNAGI